MILASLSDTNLLCFSMVPWTFSTLLSPNKWDTAKRVHPIVYFSVCVTPWVYLLNFSHHWFSLFILEPQSLDVASEVKTTSLIVVLNRRLLERADGQRSKKATSPPHWWHPIGQTATLWESFFCHDAHSLEHQPSGDYVPDPADLSQDLKDVVLPLCLGIHMYNNVSAVVMLIMVDGFRILAAIAYI